MVKYLLYLVVLFTVIFSIMSLTGNVSIGFEDLGGIFATSNGRLLGVAFIALGFLQPIMGYVKREMVVNPVTSRDVVDQVMAMSGYELTSEDETRIVFRARTTLKKLVLLYEDEIVIDKSAKPATISGSRRSLVSILYRMETLKK